MNIALSTLRKEIVSVLEKEIGESTAKSYEELIYKIAQSIAKSEKREFDEFYREYAYEKVGELICATKEDRKEIVKDIISKNVGMKSFSFKKYANKQSITNDRIINPPEVKEGIIKCGKCGSKRTWCYQLQTRSADEPMTTFITCANQKCNNKWKE
jgi:DNA-directed RNA polymerase subunit M/transcription elongation factor TFIIS